MSADGHELATNIHWRSQIAKAASKPGAKTSSAVETIMSLHPVALVACRDGLQRAMRQQHYEKSPGE